MKLNYYLKDEMYQAEVNEPCPGCGSMRELAVHKKMVSYCNNRADFHIGCNCGWSGPTDKSPDAAAKAWDKRAE